MSEETKIRYAVECIGHDGGVKYREVGFGTAEEAILRRDEFAQINASGWRDVIVKKIKIETTTKETIL